MQHAADRTDLFDPYIRVPGGPQDTDQAEGSNSTIRALLMDRAAQQARQIATTVARAELDNLPPVLRGLDRETRSVMTHRIATMVAAFERFLSLDLHADVRERLDPVFRPIGAWVRGQYAVTSPALLVVQAILYSHCEWFRDRLWEAYSAARAYSELVQIGYPEAHCRFIAAIVAHQTLARTCWTLDPERDPPETYAWYCGADGRGAELAAERFHGDSARMQEAVARAIGEHLFAFIKGAPGGSVDEESRSRRGLAAALVLHALCLYARHHGEESTVGVGIKEQALRFFGFLIATWDDDEGPRPGLVFIQYGRYLHRARREVFAQLGHHIRNRLGRTSEGHAANLTLCLHRVGSSNVWRGHRFDESGIKDLASPEFPSGIGALIAPTVGHAYAYAVGDTENLRCVLGLGQDGTPPGTRDGKTVWEALASLFDAVENRHLAYWSALGSDRRYFPTPLVGHVLHAYRDIRPEAFTALHVIGKEPRTLTSRAAGDVQLTVWIPIRVDYPRETVWDQAQDADPQALVARYVAALMVAVLVSFAPRRLLLDYVSEEARRCWSLLIAKAFEGNGGLLMQHYAEQIRCLKADHDLSGGADPWGIRAGKAERLRWTGSSKTVTVVGIDIGGTAIKATAIDVRDCEDLFAAPAPQLPGVVSFGWGEIAGSTPTERIRSLLAKALEGLQRPPRAVGALGISFAGPVADGVPVGVSGIMGNEPGDEKIGYTRHIVAGNPHELHRVDFCRAAREIGLGQDTEAGAATAVVLNDGDADIRSGEKELDLSQEGNTLVIKEGTGIAFALYEAGMPVDHPCETAKAIVNLRSEPANRTEAKPFQGGQLGLYVSKAKLGALLPNALGRLHDAGLRHWANDILGRALGHLLERALASDPGAAHSPVIDRAMAAQTLPDDPTAKARVAAIVAAAAGMSGIPETQRTAFAGDRLAGGIADDLRAVGMAIAAGHWDRCAACHTEASKALGQRRWSAVEKMAGDYLDGIGDSPPELPALDGARRWDSAKCGLDLYEMAAVGCAWVLGRWLADGIALSWDLYGMRELRLAGGPLGGATGLYIAQSARTALKEVYGFDLDATGGGTGPLNRSDWYASARRREIKALCLIDPPEDSSEGGPLGAAMAAFDGYLAGLKLRQLKACRNASESFPDAFSVDDLIDKAKQDFKGTPWILDEEEVAAVLARESMVLGLTRVRDGGFRRWTPRGTTP